MLTQDLIQISLESSMALLLFLLPSSACFRCYSVLQFLFLLTIYTAIVEVWYWLLVNLLHLSHHKIVMLSSLLVLFPFFPRKVLRDDQYRDVIHLVSMREFFFQWRTPLDHLWFPGFKCTMFLFTILHFGYDSYHVVPKFLIFASKLLITGDDILYCSIKLALLEAQDKQVNLGALGSHTSCHIKNLLIVAWRVRQPWNIYKVD